MSSMASRFFFFFDGLGLSPSVFLRFGGFAEAWLEGTTVISVEIIRDGVASAVDIPQEDLVVSDCTERLTDIVRLEFS